MLNYCVVLCFSDFVLGWLFTSVMVNDKFLVPNFEEEDLKTNTLNVSNSSNNKYLEHIIPEKLKTPLEKILYNSWKETQAKFGNFQKKLIFLCKLAYNCLTIAHVLWKLRLQFNLLIKAINQA